MKKLLILLSIAGVLANANVPASYTVQKAYDPFPTKSENAYAYAPATVYFNGVFHQFYCSTGKVSDDNYFHPDRDAFSKSWDHIRYRTSIDGINWSAPRIVLTVSIEGSGTENERCACDPSVVYDSLDGYWYMMYDGNLDDFSGTVVYLARSKAIGGPYEKYTGNGWARYPKKPKPIMTNKRKYDGYHDDTKYVKNPLNKKEEDIYGVGQQSVVFKDGYFHVWFNDKEKYFRDGCKKAGNCEPYFEIRYVKTERLESIDFNSSLINDTSVFKKVTLYDSLGSLKDSSRLPYGITGVEDVRWNDNHKVFELWTNSMPSENMPYIHKYTSEDGVYWERDLSFNIGPYLHAHNMGISSNEYGWIVDSTYLISFSAPYEYGSLPASVSRPVYEGIWPMYQMWVKNDGWYSYSVKIKNGAKMDIVPKDAEYYSGDFDGDGITDIGVLYRGRINKWYTVYSQKEMYAGNVLQTEGKTFRGMSSKHKIIIGDFDGDGKDDRGMYTESGAWHIYSSKTNGGEGIFLTSNDVNGLANIPWGWTWPGMTGAFAVPSGDYDGDGIADRVIVNKEYGLWYIISSRARDFMYADVYDIRPSENCADGWVLFSAADCAASSVLRSNYHHQDTLFGYHMSVMTVKHEVVVGDFDGDGIMDRATVDKTNKKWYVIPSASQNEKLPINRRGDKLYGYVQENLDANSIIAIGDYDGDGIDDLSFVNKKRGRWYFRRSTTGAETYVAWRNLNTSDSIQLLPGDYDGDGITDMAFINTATGKFYVRSSKKSNQAGTDVFGIDETMYRPYPIKNGGLAKKGYPKIGEDKMILPEPVLFDVESAGKSIHISGLTGTESVAVMDIRGKVVYSSANHGTELNLNLPAFGKYIVRVGTVSKMITVR